MKILFTEQIQQAYNQTTKRQRITRKKLTDRASEQVFLWLQHNTDLSKKVVVYAGVGNNGGDGLAVARMLAKAKRDVEVYIVNFNENPTDNFLKNLGALVRSKKVKITDLYSCSEAPEVMPNDIILDAVFGTGLNRYVTDWMQCILEKINESGAYVVSIDVPSGFYLDRVPMEDEVFIKSDMALTFQTPKLIFLLPQTGKYIPNWKILDIGLESSVLNSVDYEYQLITDSYINEIYKPREKFSHKGSFGHTLLVGGSYGKIGAMVLGGTAVLRSGAGLLTMLAPKCGYEILQTAVPEAMVVTSKGKKYLSPTQIPIEPSVIGIGIGMGNQPQTATVLFELFEQYSHLPFVIDADAINILSENPEQIHKIPKNAILTPHPAELERLIGKWKDDFDKMDKAKKFAKKHQIILVIKDAYTMITNGIRFWINSTGNAGMATAGSGDVLTGIVTGLLSQNYSPLEAAILGVHTHGKAGDRVVSKKGQENLIARDLCKEIRLKTE